MDMQARRYRAQQHSPPERLDNTISIYTDRSGDPGEAARPLVGFVANAVEHHVTC